MEKKASKGLFGHRQGAWAGRNEFFFNDLKNNV